MSRQAHRNSGTFFLHGSRDAGVLLVHGYTGAPAEMRMLGNFLQAKGGYTVLGVCLAGLVRSSRRWCESTAQSLPPHLHSRAVHGRSAGH